MPATPQNTMPILDDAEASRRELLLTRLQAALAELGVQCTLARTHRLVLRYAEGVSGPNGLTDPQLYVFTEPGPAKVTTDGAAYQLSDGQNLSAANPAAAAAIISRPMEPRRPHLTTADPGPRPVHPGHNEVAGRFRSRPDCTR